jgi:hypothetical protein
MVDLILATFVVATFAGGFWCGARFGSFKAMTARARERVRSWL